MLLNHVLKLRKLEIITAYNVWYFFQIRPEGGFFEERYKEIFPTDIDIPIATASDHDTRYGTPNSVVIRSIVSEDGKALVDAVNGKSPNPCFDTNRLSRNSLLVLACSLQQADSQLENQAK